jgi:serine palmitoyltransferase small subunit
MYYQYEVTFSPYVLTPGEKFVLNTIVVVLLTLLFVGMTTYLPKLVARAAVRLFWLYTGANDKITVNNTAIWNEMNAATVYER